MAEEAAPPPEAAASLHGQEGALAAEVCAHAAAVSIDL